MGAENDGETKRQGPDDVGLVFAAHNRHASPTQAARRAERWLRAQEALNGLDPIDRETPALRYFEQLGRAEEAQAQG